MVNPPLAVDLPKGQKMVEDLESVYDLRFNINYYGADYPVDSLAKRMEDESILIPAFQRQYVWKPREASRFIESLLIGLPVPNIFLAIDKFSRKLLIVDGLQRLNTIRYFYKGNFPNGKKFKLKDVTHPFEGLGYDDLSMKDKLNLDNFTIHATIISESDDSNRMYHLFERLNTSGTPLRPQEIRTALYHGDFNVMLGELSHHETWRNLYGKIDNRMTDQELILRFFAIYYDSDSFQGTLAEFLNHFMYKNRMFEFIPKKDMVKLFSETLTYISTSVGKDAFVLNKRFSSSLYDAIMFCGSKSCSSVPKDTFRRFHNEIVNDENFLSLTRSATTSRKNIFGRIEYALQKLNI